MILELSVRICFLYKLIFLEDETKNEIIDKVTKDKEEEDEDDSDVDLFNGNFFILQIKLMFYRR